MKNFDILEKICSEVRKGRFDWQKYLSPHTYFGYEICVTPLHASYGQIGYTVYFPYSDMPMVEYDWELDKLTVIK